MNEPLSDSDLADLQLTREAAQTHVEFQSLEPAPEICNSTKRALDLNETGEDYTDDIAQNVNRIAFGTENKLSRSSPAKYAKKTEQEVDHSEEDQTASNDKCPRPTVPHSDTAKSVRPSPKAPAREGALVRPKRAFTRGTSKINFGENVFDVPDESSRQSNSKLAPTEKAYRQERSVPDGTHEGTPSDSNTATTAVPALAAKRGRGRPRRLIPQTEKSQQLRSSSNERPVSKGHNEQEDSENVATEPLIARANTKASKDVSGEKQSKEHHLDCTSIHGEEDSSQLDDILKSDAISTQSADRLSSPSSSEPRSELLGQDDRWESIVSAVRELDKLDVPDIKTSTIKAMIKSIGEVRKMYEIAAPGDVGMEDSTRVQQLDDVDFASPINCLVQEVKSLSKLNLKGMNSKVTQDVYAHAVPQLVEMLEAAFRCRSAELSNDTNCNVLEEVIDLQDILLSLYETVKDWKAKPSTKKPITKPIIHIKSELKQLRKVFFEELKKRKRELEQKANTKRLQKRQRDRDRSFKREQELHIQKKAAIQRQIEQEVSRNISKWHSEMRIQAPHGIQT